MTNKEKAEYRRGFIVQHYEKEGLVFCLENLGIKKEAFDIHRKSLGIKIREEERIKALEDEQEKRDKNYKFPVEKFLRCDSYQMAYLLGLGWGDGNVSKNTFNISILSTDMANILPHFNNFGTFNLLEYKPKMGRCQTQISVTNKTIADFLKFHLFDQKKSSPDSIISKISPEFRHLFFRGFLDADGCIFCKKYGNRDRCKITFSSCYDQNWNFMENLLDQLSIKFGIIKVFGRKGFPNRSYSSLEISGFESQIKFLNYIYKNYKMCNIGLTRKYKKALEVSNVYHKKPQFKEVVNF